MVIYDAQQLFLSSNKSVSMTSAFEQSAGAVLITFIDNIPQYLLLRSVNGFWGIAKGHHIAGETVFDTARREVFEETGLELYPVNSFFAQVTYLTKQKTPKQVSAFLGVVEQLSIQLSAEHTEFVFVPFEAILHYLGDKLVQYDLFCKAHEFLSESNRI
jgi:8-oxo-dGTP pyrophosphatase MutT (NUDIX family)